MRDGLRFDPCTAHVAAWLNDTGAALKPDRETARRFLQRLEAAQPDRFSFRTFSDTPYTRRAGYDPLERAIHGSLESCWDELVRLNRAGAAVAVTINRTNGHGREIGDIERVRALFLDDDRGGDPARFALQPHLQVITSNGHAHYYWLVEELDPSLFGACQRRLAARYAGDDRVFALNQAMQLPGFWRRKRIDQPRMPRLRELSRGPALRPTQLPALLGDFEPA